MDAWLDRYDVAIIAVLAGAAVLLLVAWGRERRRHRRDLTPWRLAERLGRLVPDSDMWLHVPRLAEESGELDYFLARLDSLWARRRRDAARTVGAIGSDRSVAVLLGHLRDPDRRVREEVVRALGKIGAQESLPALASLLEAPAWGDPAIVIDAIVRFGPEAETQVKPYLTHPSAAVRGAAAETIRRIHGEPPSPPVRALRAPTVIDALLSVAKTLITVALAGTTLAVFVALVLGALRAPEALTDLLLRFALVIMSIVGLLVVLNFVQRIAADRRDRRLEHRRRTVEALIKTFLRAPGDLRLRERLRRYLRQPDVVEQASRSFSDAEKDALRQALMDMDLTTLLDRWATRARRKWRRVQALVLLGWLRAPASIPLLRQALGDPDEDIGYAAAAALGQYEGAAAYGALLDALGAGRLSRSRLAGILESSHCRRPLSLLFKAADDFSPEVRFWVAYLLGRTRNQNALPVLARLAGDEDANVRTNAAEALGELGNRLAAPLLKKLLADDSWVVRAHAAKAVGMIGDEQLIEDLMPLLRDEEWWVRQNAALALEKLGRQTVPYLQMFLTDRDRFARNKAAEVLGRLGVVAEQVARLAGPPVEAEAAHEFLLGVGAAEAVSIIEDETERADPAGQERLIDILAEIGDPRSLPLLERLRDSQVEAVRRGAQRAIERLRKSA